MNRLNTLGEVREHVENLSRNCWDDEVPVKSLVFKGLNTALIAGEEHHLRPAAQRSIACRLGIPMQYLSKCDPQLQSINMNYWLSHERNEELFFRFDGNEVRAIFTPRYTPIDNREVLNRLDAHGYGPNTPVQCRLDEDLMMLNIPDESKTFRLNGRDEMRPGISIANSEVGLSSLTLSAFVLRLVCTNGLISKTTTDSSYRHISNRVLDEFPVVLQNVTDELDRQRNQWALSTESKVAQPESTIKSFNRQFTLDKTECEAVEWAWPIESGDTMFHIINTYTRSSQYDSLNAEQSYHLQRVGGCILALLN
jgi:hypothetical protein